MADVGDQTAGHGLGPTRARVLSHLTGLQGGTNVVETASALEIHSNTARFHLEALVESGYAERELERPQGQGRPRTRYRATERAPVVDTAHLRDLTQVLVKQLILQAPDPGAVAETVGRAWGLEVGRGGEVGLAPLLEHTVEMGFSVQQPDNETITFQSCPYRSVSQPVLASICQVHLGMLRGYLSATGSDVAVESLTPGSVCVAKLRLLEEMDGAE